MFEDVIFQNLWLVIPIWLLVSFLDHYFTFLAAREYKAGGKEHFLVEGSLELSPFHQKDVDAGRLYSPRALLVESIAIAVIVAFWIGWRTSKDPGALAFMQFLIGGFIVVRLRIASGNARMFFTLRSNRRHEGISGQTQYRRWRVYRDAATGDFLLSGVFFGLFLFTGSPSLLGGSFWAVAAGRADLGTSRKLKLAAEAGPPALAAGGVLEAPKEPRFAEWSMERDRKEREVPRSVLGARLYARFFSVQVVPAILGIACFGLCFRGVSRLVLPRTSGMDPAFLLACLGILLLACAFRANYASLMVPHKTLAVLLGIVVTSYFFFFVIGLPLLVFLLRIDVPYGPGGEEYAAHFAWEVIRAGSVIWVLFGLMCVGTWLAIVRVIFAQYRYPYELGSRSRFATVATLLVLFGFLGAHRFFVGKIVSGALYLVTMGFLGIGVLIDGILLMCRKFKDKEGNVI